MSENAFFSFSEMTGLLNPNSSEILHFFMHGSRCIPRTRHVLSGINSRFIFLQSFLGTAFKLLRWETTEKKCRPLSQPASFQKPADSASKAWFDDWSHSPRRHQRNSSVRCRYCCGLWSTVHRTSTGYRYIPTGCNVRVCCHMTIMLRY